MENSSAVISETGVIHGRFQILHNDHMKYILEGKKQCHHLVVGITNPDPILTRKEKVDQKRDNPIENPLTYFERYLLIKAALVEHGISLKDFSITPFPINLPDLYKYYVPLDGLFFLTIYDDWGRRKHHYFKSLGLNTHIIRNVPEEEKGISATDIRLLMIDNKPWKHLVPKSVFDYLTLWDIPSRLRSMSQHHP